MACQADAQTVTPITCDLWTINSVFSCVLFNHNLTEDYNQELLITNGVQNDANFRAIEIRAGNNIPFMLNVFWTRFTNVFRVLIFPSGMTRLQPNGFRNARSVELVIITNNPLRRIHEDAFLGASSLITLDLRDNIIETVHEDAFNGLDSLQNLMMEDNRIRVLPPHVFRPMPSIEFIYLSDNLIETINGRMFTNNANLRTIDLVRNRVNEVGRSIIDPLDNLHVLSLVGNRCVNNFWVVDDTTSKDQIRQGLTTCFSNYDITRRLTMFVRGSVAIDDDFGNELMNVSST